MLAGTGRVSMPHRLSAKDLHRQLLLLPLLALLTAAPARAAVLEIRDVRGSAGEVLCVDVAGSAQANGTSLITFRCHGGTNQSFTFNRGSGELRSALGNWCVDLSGGNAGQGARIQLWSCNGGAAQQF